MNVIVAISTASGIGGIGIIRMSGKGSFEILSKIFRAKRPQKIGEIPGYSMKYGEIFDEKNKIDEVLVSYFKGSKSYTAENMCEINCHGGNVIMQKILSLCLENGATLAEPGEFTKRAFLNGRIDLTQAESVIDIINAKNLNESKANMKQLDGFLSRKISGIKENIMKVMINIEVEIDYPEYDVVETTSSQIEKMLNVIQKELELLKKSFESGKIIKDGVKTVIIGRPNAGKSSLLNRLLKEERAIVTEVEGTTRDTIEEHINILGVPIKLVDTAGIRESSDEVEKIGIEKAKKLAKESDLVILILDVSKELTKEDKEVLEIVKNKKAVVVLNKVDLAEKRVIFKENIKELCNNVVEVSVKNNIGIEKLEQIILEMFKLNEINFDNEIIVTNARHQNIINSALKNIDMAQESIKLNVPVDMVAIHIKEIMENLASITGENITEDIIDEIFAKFCLGK